MQQVRMHISRGTDQFLMAHMADEHRIHFLVGEFNGFLVDLGHQRAGGIDDILNGVHGLHR